MMHGYILNSYLTHVHVNISYWSWDVFSHLDNIHVHFVHVVHVNVWSFYYIESVSIKCWLIYWCFSLWQFADVEAQFADDDADPNAAGYHRLRDDVTLPTISDTMSDVLLPPPSELFDADSSRQASTSGRDVTPSTAAAPPTQAATVDTKDVTLGFSSISSGLVTYLWGSMHVDFLLQEP